MILQILSKSDRSCFCRSFFHWGKSSDKHPSLLYFINTASYLLEYLSYFNFNMSLVSCQFHLVQDISGITGFQVAIII